VTATLSPDEIKRYARHIVLRGVGGDGQQKLKAARVLVIGAGGLGSPLIAYLAAAGVGTLGVVDHDTVSLSNLQRQMIHQANGIGTAKAESAGAFVAGAQRACRVYPAYRADHRRERRPTAGRLSHGDRRHRQFRHPQDRRRGGRGRRNPVGFGGGVDV
jgi:hypothetical protein